MANGSISPMYVPFGGLDYYQRGATLTHLVRKNGKIFAIIKMGVNAIYHPNMERAVCHLMLPLGVTL